MRDHHQTLKKDKARMEDSKRGYCWPKQLDMLKRERWRWGEGWCGFYLTQSVVTSKEASLQVRKKNQKCLLQPSFILNITSQRERKRKRVTTLTWGPMNNVHIGVMWATSRFHNIWDIIIICIKYIMILNCDYSCVAVNQRIFALHVTVEKCDHSCSGDVYSIKIFW